MSEPQRFPFDAEAAGYDETFSSSLIGTAMRRAVWRRLDVNFEAGQRILELCCGTGEDAVYLARRGVRVLATDRSGGMVGVTRSKVEEAGLTEQVEVVHSPIEELGAAPGAHGQPFDAALSNFGALNCVSDLPAVARSLSTVLRPGGRVVLCIMGPWVPWEWAWFLARGRPRDAFRRLRRGGVLWRGLRVHYPGIGAMRRAFEPAFRLSRVAAVGALVPPSYAESWAARHPRWLARLDRWERRFETVQPLPWLADHYLAEFELRSIR